MSEAIEMGTMSSRGQIAIPSGIREQMGLKEGSKVLFFLEGSALLMKKVDSKTFEEITRPLKQIAKKHGWKEEDIPDLVHRFRKSKT